MIGLCPTEVYLITLRVSANPFVQSNWKHSSSYTQQALTHYFFILFLLPVSNYTHTLEGTGHEVRTDIRLT